MGLEMPHPLLNPSTLISGDSSITNEQSISELLSSVKTTFFAKDFADIEQVLITRENEMKFRIKALEKENELLRQRNAKLIEEKKFAYERDKNAEERCKKLLEETKRREEGDKRTILELSNKNMELECAKDKAESELRMLRKKFEELQERVFKIEKESSIFIKNLPIAFWGGTVSGSIQAKEESGNESGGKCVGKEIKKYKDSRVVGSGNLGSEEKNSGEIDRVSSVKGTGENTDSEDEADGVNCNGAAVEDRSSSENNVLCADGRTVEERNKENATAYNTAAVDGGENVELEGKGARWSPGCLVVIPDSDEDCIQEKNATRMPKRKRTPSSSLRLNGDGDDSDKEQQQSAQNPNDVSWNCLSPSNGNITATRRRFLTPVSYKAGFASNVSADLADRSEKLVRELQEELSSSSSSDTDDDFNLENDFQPPVFFLSKNQI